MQTSSVHLLYAEFISFFVTRKCQKSEKLMKTVNIDGENLHIFWTNKGISNKFSGKFWLMIILKVTKTEDFTLFIEDTFLKKSQGESNWLPGLLKVKFIHFYRKESEFQWCFLVSINSSCPNPVRGEKSN